MEKAKNIPLPMFAQCIVREVAVTLKGNAQSAEWLTSLKPSTRIMGTNTKLEQLLPLSGRGGKKAASFQVIG
jgi:hypothetical protein